MNPYYLAVDIGASSGRHILAHLEDGKMVLEEIHRFPNGMVQKDGENVWDVDELFAQIKLGMKKCAEAGKIPVSIGIDTWGVDFVLLDAEGKRIGNAVAYRDGRTKGMDQEVYKKIPEDELYARTGIQKAIFNTIYQLMALKVKKPEQLEKELTEIDGIVHFEQLVRRWMEDGRETEELTGLLMNRRKGLVLISDEIGYGLVPVDAFERKYREAHGRLMTDLAAQAQRVDRVVCGIGTRLR